MDKNYFGLVCEAISQANRIKNFKKIKKDESNFEFQANEKHYLINLDSQKKLIILNIIDDENNSSKNLSSWLFDEDTLTQKDIDDISSDFIETMSVKEKSSHKKSSKSQKNSSDDTNVNDMFFANRMVNFFPELKEKMQIEKDSYETFRTATFIKNEVLPTINDFLKSGDKSRISKFGKLISDLYKNGDLSVRSIITIVILNNLDEASEGKIKQNLSEELKNAYESAKKYKNKAVKPEKRNTKKSFMTKVLETQNQ